MGWEAQGALPRLRWAAAFNPTIGLERGRKGSIRAGSVIAATSLKMRSLAIRHTGLVSGERPGPNIWSKHFICHHLPDLSDADAVAGIQLTAGGTQR